MLAFPVEGRSDAPKITERGTETLMAKRQSESLGGAERLMEEAQRKPTAERRFDFEFRSRCGATWLAYIDPHEVSTNAGSGAAAAAEPTGESSRRVSRCGGDRSHAETPKAKARHPTQEARIFGSANAVTASDVGL